jgi:chromosome segregation ATPase
MRGTPNKEIDAQRLEKKPTKKLSKEWLRLQKEEKALESRMRKLETQRENISSDVLDPLFIRDQERLESLRPLQHEIEMELESIRKIASEEISFLEDELNPIQKRLGEFQSLYKLGAVTKPDFVREKK